MLTKGNIVQGNNSGRHAIVLAVRKDGTAAKLYEYGPDREVWVPVKKFTVTTTGMDQCFKCLGSGLYFMGGAVVNGRYTGKTGICFACEGKGEQSDADRLRNHYYWHRQVEEGETVESPLEPNPQQPLPAKPTLREVVAKRKSQKKNHPDPERKALGKVKVKRTVHGVRSTTPASDAVKNAEPVLLDPCPGCGFMHRDDVMCV
jgi:hypothetical protein